MPLCFFYIFLPAYHHVTIWFSWHASTVSVYHVLSPLLTNSYCVFRTCHLDGRGDLREWTIRPCQNNTTTHVVWGMLWAEYAEPRCHHNKGRASGHRSWRGNQSPKAHETFRVDFPNTLTKHYLWPPRKKENGTH